VHRREKVYSKPIRLGPHTHAAQASPRVLHSGPSSQWSALGGFGGAANGAMISIWWRPKHCLGYVVCGDDPTLHACAECRMGSILILWFLWYNCGAPGTTTYVLHSVILYNIESS
jgi:hypothetical protein